MNQISALRDGLGNVYRQHDYWLQPLFRALTALVMFIMIRLRLGGSGMFGSLPVLLAAAIFCAFLPWTAISFFSAALVLGNLFAQSLEMTLVGTLVFLMAGLIQSAFRAKAGILLALLPFFYALHLPYVVVLAAGLTLGALGFIPLVLGTFIYYFLRYVTENAGSIGTTTDVTEMANQYAGIFSGFLANREMLLMAAVVTIGFLTVCIIRNLPANYAFELSVVSGCILMGGLLMAGSAADVVAGFSGQLLSLLASLLLGLLYILLFHGADYRGSERLQFEDEEYYYYVKAVPKRWNEKKGE